MPFLHPRALVGPALAALLAALPALAQASGPIVYIPTGDSAGVLAIDATTHAEIGRIADLPAAHGIAATPDGQRLVVGSFAERPAGTEAPERPDAVSEDDHAAHHAPAATPPAWEVVSNVSIVDTATRTILRRIEVPGAVHHVAVSPNGRTAAVTHPSGNAITAIDLVSLSPIATVPTGALPNYAAYSADGGLLYVSNSGADTISVIDTRSWNVTATIAVGDGPEHVAISPDGQRLVVNNVADGSLSVIDLAEQGVIATLPVGAAPHGVDFADDGTTVFVALTGEDSLAAIDLATGARRSVMLAPAPYHLSAIRGAGVLYVSSAAESRVWVIDAATLSATAEVAISGIGHQFAQTAAH